MWLNNKQTQGNQDLIINNIWARKENMFFWINYQMCEAKAFPVTV